MHIGSTVAWNSYIGIVLAVENRNGNIWIVAEFDGYGTHQGPESIFKIEIEAAGKQHTED